MKLLIRRLLLRLYYRTKWWKRRRARHFAEFPRCAVRRCGTTKNLHCHHVGGYWRVFRERKRISPLFVRNIMPTPTSSTASGNSATSDQRQWL